MSETYIQVAAGVVVDRAGRVLVAKRPVDKHQGGLWEFPGGKIEPGETTREALSRELAEEVGIAITASEPLIRIHHDYPDKSVCLDVLRVTDFSGEAWGREGQEIAWVQPEDLPELRFPAANKPIVAAARLPRYVMITGAFETESDCLQRVEQGLDSVGLVHFRAPWLERRAYIDLAKQIHRLCRQRNLPMVANCALEDFQEIRCEGLHLNSAGLLSATSRPVPKDIWLSAACHSEAELQKAEAINVDFALLSPVQPTPSHPNSPHLGWQRFNELADQAALPVYALGGVGAADTAEAIAHGAQGIAGISAFWRGS